MENDPRPHFANLTLSTKYLRDLPKLAQHYNVQLTLPIMVSPDTTQTNFTVVGSHNDVLKFVQKFENDKLIEGKAFTEAHQEEEKHEGPISNDDVMNVKILANASKTVDDFISSM